MTNKYKAAVAHRQSQLATKLLGPPDKIQADSVEPESLMKLMEKDRGGLLYVTDDAFAFFKVLMIKLRKLQNLMALQTHPSQVFSNAVNALYTDADALTLFWDLFIDDKNDENCQCTQEANQISSPVEHLIDAELNDTLIYDLYEKIVHYLCRVHLAEQMFRLKDHTLKKKKTFRLRTQVDNLKSKDTDGGLKPVPYPCGICGKECIDIMNKQDAVFADFSVLCDFCNKWYHLICEGLTGQEQSLQEGNAGVFKCKACICAAGHEVAISTENVIEQQLPTSHVQKSATIAGPAKSLSKKPKICTKKSKPARKSTVPQTLIVSNNPERNDTSNSSNTDVQEPVLNDCRRSARKRYKKEHSDYIYNKKK